MVKINMFCNGEFICLWEKGYQIGKKEPTTTAEAQQDSLATVRISIHIATVKKNWTKMTSRGNFYC